MKEYIHIALFLFFSTTSINSIYAQGVAVNTDGSTADASAMLDVKSTSKGMLVPRVTSTASVTSPANGLLVYQTNAPIGFYYYNGSVWIYLQNTGAVSGILKGNGTTVNAAVAGTDYLSPTGSAAGLTGFPMLNQNTSGNAATVTTNANLTGDVTSSGNTTSYNNVVPSNKGGAGTVNGILLANGSGTVNAASTTGSGSVVLSSSPSLTNPTLSNPALGTPSALVGTNITGTATAFTAGKVITNANLTGDVTSVGNASSYNNIVPIAKGGTGTASPALVAGSNVTITGTWPNQTIAASSGGSSYVIAPIGSVHTVTKATTTFWSPVASLGAATPAGSTVAFLPAACKPSMTIYSLSDVAVTFTLYTATLTGGANVTGAANTAVISCTTAASSGGVPTVCTATASTQTAAGTYLSIQGPAAGTQTNAFNPAALVFSCQ